MSVAIDYYFTHMSPWAYLGHAPFLEIARKHGVTINVKPVDLRNVFSETGGQPLAKRHPSRQAYRFVEMQRWKEFRNVPLTFRPKYFPTDPSLADRCAIALNGLNGPTTAFSERTFMAIWAEEKDISDAATLSDILLSLKVDPAEVLDLAASNATGETYERYSQEAMDAGAFGSPCYVLKGEPFWGQDRLDLLDAALTSKRDPYLPL